MTITIYGTDWCPDTRRTRAFVASHGLRAAFVDIEARPEMAEHLMTSDDAPLSIPVVEFSDGTRLDEPSDEDLVAALAAQHGAKAIRHRTNLNVAERRFEQFRNGILVATASFEERDGVIVIVDRAHLSDDPEVSEADTVERLTTGLVEITRRSNRGIEIAPPSRAKVEVSAAAMPEPTTPRLPSSSPSAQLSTGDLVRSDDKIAVSDAEPAGCPLTRAFSDLWAEGTDHLAATQLAKSKNLGRLATIKALHEQWEMPLTADAAAMAFGESSRDDLAAMFHTLTWIIEQNPTSTMSELQAFDDATGISLKTQALSLAGRPRDTISIVDRMEAGLHLRPIDEETARAIAASTIREDEGQLRIQDQSTMRHAFGWMFLYQSARYIETGDYSAMISGNAPLLVDRFSGAVWITDTEYRPAVYAANYLATGNPRAGPNVGPKDD